MNHARHQRPLRPALAALALAGLLALPPFRHALESGMTAHMALQFPLLGLCGLLLAGALPRRWRARIAPWNAHGIAGLLAVTLVLAALMIPRVLDLALVDAPVEAAKWLALLAAGAALRLSWRPAGRLVQGFFLGNLLPMMAAAGQLYQDAPVRLCNAYLLDDQVRLGQWLVGGAVLVALLWLGRVFAALARRDAALA